MKLYRQDVRICGTVYIKAKSKAEALAKIKALGECEVSADIDADIPISDLRYDDPQLPAISLSPAMTLKGVEPGCALEIVR